MEYQRKRQPDHPNILPSRPDLQSTHTDLVPLQRAMQRFTSTPTTTQRQAVTPVLRAANLHRQEEEHLIAQRSPLQRQVTDLSATLPADAIQTALQRQASERSLTAVPAHPQTAGEWVTVMRHRAEQVDGTRMDARSTQAFTTLQRQVTAALVHSVKHDPSPALRRHSAFAEHAVSLQRHALTRHIPRAALAQLPPGERLSLQRAVDEATQADALQRQQDAQALQLHSLQRHLAELDEQATKPVMERIQARRGSGNPLPVAVQRHLEQGLNHDLSAVRIHDDAEADKLAKGVNATAFTTGTDIYFRSGRFNPNTQSGLELLAHEVTHTVQQSQGRVGKGIDPDAGLENEARVMGKRLANRNLSAVQRDRPVTSRQGFPATGTAVQRSSETPTSTSDWALSFLGQLAGKKVTLRLRKSGSRFHGNYQYSGQNGRLSVEGKASDPRQLHLTERAAQGKVTGQFAGALQESGEKTTYQGQWTGAETGRSYAFAFQEAGVLDAPEPVSTAPWEQTYHGTIGTYAITMKLRAEGTKVIGEYFYNNQPQNPKLSVRGVLSGRQINLTAGSEAFKGTIATDHKSLQGTWTGTGTALPFKLGGLTVPAAPPANQRFSGTLNLPGTIGKYSIQVKLNFQSGQVSGAYGYKSQGNTTPFALSGRVDNTGKLELLSGEERFKGRFDTKTKTAKGTWEREGKQLAFQFGEAVENGNLGTPFRLNELKGLQQIAARVYNLHSPRLIQFSAETGIKPEVIVAIICSESQGYAGSGGDMLIRFEVHKFYQFWGAANEAIFGRHFKFNRSGKPWKGHQVSFDGKTWSYLHPTGTKADLPLQYRALELAIKLGQNSAEPAYKCLGMGLGQVQGFNFTAAGYSSAAEMYAKLKSDEGNQIKSIFDFIKKKSRLLQAARVEDFNGVEYYYNGGGQNGIYAQSMQMYTRDLRAAAGRQKIDLLTGGAL